MGGELVSGVIIAPIVVFLVIVAPLWIIAHYVTRWRSARGISPDDERVLEDMWRTAERLEERLRNVEGVLDEGDRDWRTAP